MKAFLSWAIAGFLVTFSLLSLPSIGLFIVPAAVLATAWSARTYRIEGAFGFLCGLGAVLLVIGALNVGGPPPCLEQNGRFTLPPGTHECGSGGLDPAPWFLVGAACVVIASVAGLLTARRRRDGTAAPSTTS